MISNRAVQNFRRFVASGEAERVTRDGRAISIAAFEPLGAYDSVPVGSSLEDFKAFLSLNLPPTAVVKASLLLKNMLSLLDIDDDGDLDPSFFADDEAARFSRPASDETIELCARWDADFSGSAEPAEIGSADHRPQRLSPRGQACRDHHRGSIAA